MSSADHDVASVASGEADASERRVREGMPWVDAFARRLERRLGGLVRGDDLRSVGHAALLEASRSFDPSKAEFRTYGSRKIRWAILDACRKETHGRAQATRLAALTASERFGESLVDERRGADDAAEEDERVSLRQILAGHAAALALGLVVPVGALDAVADGVIDVDERLARLQLAAVLRQRVAQLPDRERALVVRHYFDGEPFDAIARDLGISKSWASRIHGQAIRALADAMSDVEPRIPRT
jgi:RNA polymerase sigma factor for flagellar operon FliA